MLRPTQKFSSHAPWKRLAFPAILVFSLALFSLETARAGVIASFDFEDGTLQGWTAFNGSSSPANTTAAAFSGIHSLLSTTSSSGAGGPAVSLSGLLVPNEQYTITGEIELTPGESATHANFTMKVTDPTCGGGICFDTVGNFQVPVSPSSFAAIGGTFNTNSTETGFLLYAQLVGPSTAQSFYLDDVVITDIGAVPAPEPGSFLMVVATLVPITLAGWRRRRA